jgi:hypothetical protein
MAFKIERPAAGHSGEPFYVISLVAGRHRINLTGFAPQSLSQHASSRQSVYGKPLLAEAEL